ncbi:imidazole glycerol phosphate synthase, glutamine amidotransferase subunit [Methanolacinia petrolearia DSM 11571]|uniref:Imidazole glycerol phosphate synthase subunit HisH n=1 Tax=Methanolacinia petrolearia (strain DSM 11571 / OCM 486 / SEBR 4847) TaxID=679926 RepID=E1RGP8_METP4|nr:imidazole glycerol phosphate synthase subunit HisH [Methanolacinia petrolearia]ADN36343.1 imidazole glycerol phosphate synthase, glutamine amidotransferase subunit [Methanolacinia petrolearia DSM 11571]
MTQVAILDYGLGNLRSVKKGVEKAGASVFITSDVEEMATADGVVLPGVGAFSEGMEKLNEMKKALMNYVESSPVLGICLGMQMLLDVGEEYGIHEGLGLVPGRVKQFPERPGYKIPHMGWNTLKIVNDDPLFEGIPDNSYVYFVHSYYAETEERYTLTSTDYICEFSSSIRNKNAWGTQFHPEKSGETGLKILENFIGML